MVNNKICLYLLCLVNTVLIFFKVKRNKNMVASNIYDVFLEQNAFAEKNKSTNHTQNLK